MNSRKTLFALAAAVAMTSLTAVAQERYLVNMRLTCRTTTESGRLITKTITTHDIIRWCAARGGLGTTNLNRFVMIYDVNSDYNGDTIKVVRREDGGTVCEPFRLLFQKPITEEGAQRQEIFSFIFNNVNTESMGSVILTKRAVADRQEISGKFQMYDEVFFPTRKGICTGSFVTGRQISSAAE